MVSRSGQKRWHIFQAVAVLSLTTVLSAVVVSAAFDPTQACGTDANFLLILADDLGAPELGCYGNTVYRTPNLDRLASQGIRFETCYATPICTPSRVALLTGQYGFRTGYFNLLGSPYTPLPNSSEYNLGAKLTFADLLKARGYATALSGKWQLTGQWPTLIHDCGFDEYRIWAFTNNLPPGVQHTGAFEPSGQASRYWHPCVMENGQYLCTKPGAYGPDLFIDFAIDFMRRHREQPFLVYCTLPLPHWPYVETPDPVHAGQRWPAGFKSSLEYLDHLVGRIVASVDGLGLRKRTVIMFLGDNGTWHLGKGTVTEAGARVPLIVRCPGTVKAGVVSRELTDITDVFPTLAQFAGADVPKD